MGGGIAGWLTPGWCTYEKRFAPHVAKPGFVATMIAEGENPKD